MGSTRLQRKSLILSSLILMLLSQGTWAQSSSEESSPVLKVKGLLQDLLHYNVIGYLQDFSLFEGSSPTFNFFENKEDLVFFVEEPDLFLQVRNLLDGEVYYTRLFDLAVYGNPFVIAGVNHALYPTIPTETTFDSSTIVVDKSVNNALVLEVLKDGQVTRYPISLFRPQSNDYVTNDNIYFQFADVKEVTNYEIEFDRVQTSSVNMNETIDQIVDLINLDEVSIYFTKSELQAMLDFLTEVKVNIASFTNLEHGPFYLRISLNVSYSFLLYDYCEILEKIQSVVTIWNQKIPAND